MSTRSRTLERMIGQLTELTAHELSVLKEQLNREVDYRIRFEHRSRCIDYSAAAGPLEG